MSEMSNFKRNIEPILWLFFGIVLIVLLYFLLDAESNRRFEVQVSDCKKAGGELKRVGLSGDKTIRRCIDDFGREMPY